MFDFDRRVARATLPLAAIVLLAGCSGGAAEPSARPLIAAAVSPSARLAISVTPAAAPTQAAIPVTADAVTQGNPALREVALDFNVGAGYEPATAILDLLRARHVPATFFVMGWLATDHPATLAAIARAGFEIGSHGDKIADVTTASDAAMVADLNAADTAIGAIIGHSTKPLWSPSAGYQDARVRGLAAGIGYDTVLWSIDSGDWRTDATAGAVEDAVLPALKPGAIVVLHYDSPQSHTATVAALPVILNAIETQGLTPVPISTLLRHLPRQPAAP